MRYRRLLALKLLKSHLVWEWRLLKHPLLRLSSFPIPAHHPRRLTQGSVECQRLSRPLCSQREPLLALGSAQGPHPRDQGDGTQRNPCRGAGRQHVIRDDPDQVSVISRGLSSQTNLECDILRIISPRRQRRMIKRVWVENPGISLIIRNKRATYSSHQVKTLPSRLRATEN